MTIRSSPRTTRAAEGLPNLFRQPAPDGYREVRRASASEAMIPRFAPDLFPLEISALEIEG